MKTIQVVLEAELLREADRAIKRLKINRSALFREALREYLKRLEVCDREARDREGFTPRFARQTGSLGQGRRLAVTVGQESLGRRVAQLRSVRMREVCAALSFALGCDLGSG